MEGDTRKTSTAAAPNQAQPGGAFARLTRDGAGSRRQLLKAGIVGVPVIVTLASRPLFGQAVNFSAGTSANLTSGNVQAQGFRGRNAATWAAAGGWPGGYYPAQKFSDVFGRTFPYKGQLTGVATLDTSLGDGSGGHVKVADLTLGDLVGLTPVAGQHLSAIGPADEDPAGVGALVVAALLDGANSTPSNPFPLSSAGVQTIFARGFDPADNLHGNWAAIAAFFHNLIAP